MKKTFYNKTPLSFFKGKRAIVNKTIKNRAGEIIEEGEEVVINDKFSGFGVSSVKTKAYINKVNCEYIDLKED